MCIFAAMLVPSFNACTDYLNVEYMLNDQRDLQDVFESMDYSKQWLAGVYSHLRNDNWDVTIKEQNANQFNFISDDMYYTDREKENDKIFGQLASYRIYRGGQYTEQFLQNQWKECYIGIRDASTYIHNIDQLVNGDNIREGMNAEQLLEHIQVTKAEARFLRAYYYWQLLRKYGPIPILPDEGVNFTDSYEELSIPRSRYDVCVDYITSELALAARDLPQREERSNLEIAKATKGAALAARAKVYLFGASPQYNGNTGAYARQLKNYDESPLIDPEKKNIRWAQAAAAAKEVIELGDYKLYTVPKRLTSTSNMKDAQGSALGFDYYRNPKTIEPGGTIVSDGSNGWKIESKNIEGYSNANFPEGWADIDPCESYRQLFDGSLTAYSNPELIFTRGYGDAIDNLSLHQIPNSLGGWNCHGLTLKMYDAYYMADGDDFYRYQKRTDPEGRLYYYSDPTADVPEYAKGYTQAINLRLWNSYVAHASMDNVNGWYPLPPGVSMQNANREPRFYASVAYNGSIWENESSAESAKSRYKQIFIYRGANGGDGKNATGFYYWTGIGIRKYYNPKDEGRSGVRIRKAEPAIRYAEVLLTYAEAINELEGSYNIPAYDGSGMITVSREQTEISRGLRPVRVRAGLTDFTDDYYDNKEEMRLRIKREWQIEFMGEAHRYYDLRRWGDAEREEAMPVWGFNMDMTGPLTYNTTEYLQRDWWHTPHEISLVPAIFAEKMYLWPISQDELRKNRKMTQNPGWKTFEE
ncbi:MAG: RagB/SusD family nutrient uptake outer membrane protein [Candidatus Ordinivivax streblomastigis]|uniref:RagB/SusD family nutrient uptake outer membrane protein n=1 Tax=Candidatus Ordinivivax streblomastigis TaxID=2540710 RepID=A0A5M8P3G1_9BACT|nr:MAG: RagB/SusD family nutrient uptake outer membrane protein [Candidatus Ordinivivax streblomastigis]